MRGLSWVDHNKRGVIRVHLERWVPDGCLTFLKVPFADKVNMYEKVRVAIGKGAASKEAE